MKSFPKILRELLSVSDFALQVLPSLVVLDTIYTGQSLIVRLEHRDRADFDASK
jgi:hypothetical protein